jgi:hypothetical protein
MEAAAGGLVDADVTAAAAVACAAAPIPAFRKPNKRIQGRGPFHANVPPVNLVQSRENNSFASYFFDS